MYSVLRGKKWFNDLLEFKLFKRRSIYGRKLGEKARKKGKEKGNKKKTLPLHLIPLNFLLLRLGGFLFINRGDPPGRGGRLLREVHGLLVPLQQGQTVAGVLTLTKTITMRRRLT